VTAPAVPADPKPLKPKRHHSNEPKAFEGLPKKPHCALCERDTAPPQPPCPVPPEPRPATHRRPREVDTAQPFGPQAGGDFWGWLGLGNRRANGHPRGGPWRQCPWTSGGGDLVETPGTLCHGQHAAGERIGRVLAGLAEGLGLRATARVCEVDPKTVVHWRVEAAEPLRAVAASCLCDLHVHQGPLNE
jgi:hypothetical protein